MISPGRPSRSDFVQLEFVGEFESNRNLKVVDIWRVSANMKFSYDYVKAKNCLSFLEHVRQLPADAEGVYF